MEMLALVATKAPVAGTIIGVPPTIWVPVLVAVVVGVFGFFNARWAVDKAGASSDAALQRTIKADREARILERQIDLYGEILTFVAERRQLRDTRHALVLVNEATYPQTYEPTDRFALVGRSEAVADSRVMKLFLASNDAEDDLARTDLASQTPGLEPKDKLDLRTRADGQRTTANSADDNLKSDIRVALHGTSWT